MKFSILIANYNNGKYFQTCYESIIKQTYDNWEVIILDDCSTDNSVELIQSLIKNDSRFSLHFNDKNSGVGITKAKLIDLAKGDVCGFVDPDDAITENAITNAINAYQKSNKIVLTYSNFYHCDENLVPVKKSNNSKQAVNDDLYFFNFPINIVHFVTFKRNVYNQTSKMDTHFKISEDQDLYLKMYEMGHVKHINDYNYLYRKHSGGISQNDNKERSYNYWAQVLFNTMKRRKITQINGKKVPEQYTNQNEIFSLLNYQNTLQYRIKKNILIWIQKIFK